MWGPSLMGSVTVASGHLLLALGPRELNSDSRVTVAATRGQRPHL